mmetsp:Transcript_130463/g.417429  ORF Transcript_130463/g.417429 Transcript_130463/m.417429 type:complete len:289 (-) Transcript_130463:634-1500(-)
MFFLRHTTHTSLNRHERCCDDHHLMCVAPGQACDELPTDSAGGNCGMPSSGPGGDNPRKLLVAEPSGRVPGIAGPGPWESPKPDLQRRRSQDKRQSLAHAKWSVPKVASCWQIWTPSSCVPHPSCGSIARPGSATTPPPAVSPATSANGSRMISANPHAPSASQASQTRSPPRSPHGPAHVCRPWPRASQRRGGTPAGSGQRRRCGGPRAAALFGSPPPTHSCDHQHGHMSCTRTPPLRPQQCTQREGVGIAPAKFPPPPEANPHALCGVTSQNKAPPPRGAPIETSP